MSRKSKVIGRTARWGATINQHPQDSSLLQESMRQEQQAEEAELKKGNGQDESMPVMFVNPFLSHRRSWVNQ
jgi:hypothetical protein